MAVNKGLAATGHAVVGAAQGGTAAVTLAAFHPDRYRCAGSLSGSSNTTINGAITAGLSRYSGVDTRNMWACPNWVGGNGTTPTYTYNCSATTTLGCGSTAPLP